MKKSEKKQQAIQNEIQNVDAQKILHDVQMNLSKSTKSNVNLDDSKLQIKLQKKSAVSAFDNELRGFFSNLKMLQKMIEKENIFILNWMKNNNLNIENITDVYLFENLPDKRIFLNEKQQKIIVTTKKYTTEFDTILVDKFVVNENKYCRIPQNKFTALQFMNLFEIAKKNQIKKQFEKIKEKNQNQKTQIKENKQVQKNIQTLKNILPNLI